jgi:hypothetical protein
MPVVEMSCLSGKEINSLLEILMNLAGGNNEIDEDGDASETQSVVDTVQLIGSNSISLTRPQITVCKKFYPLNETMLPSGACTTIDKPPEQLIIVN